MSNRFVLIGLLVLGLFAAPVSAQQGITPCAAFTLSVSNVSSNQQLSACGETVLLWNVGAQEVFYTWGAASTTAATASNWSIPGTSFVVVNLGRGRPYLASITAASTSTLRVTQGTTR